MKRHGASQEHTPPALTVGQYLTARLAELRVRHCFGVPGDYSLGLCDQLIHGGIRWVGTCNELNAGYAADAYARINGIGVVAVTYGVGGFSVLNACAGAFAETVPLVVLSGAPSSLDYASKSERPLPHHAVGRNMLAQKNAFENATAAAVVLLDPASAGAEIDDALRTCLRTSRPILLEIPIDIAQAAPVGLAARLSAEPASAWNIGQAHNPHACNAAVARCAALLHASARPALLCGVEVHRRDCEASVVRLARLLDLPVATTRHGKSSLEEGGAVCVGVYAGAMSGAAVRGYIEGADVLFVFGAAWTDMDFVACELGAGTTIVTVEAGSVSIQYPPVPCAPDAETSSQPAQPQPVLQRQLEEFAPVGLCALLDGLTLACFDGRSAAPAPSLAGPSAPSPAAMLAPVRLEPSPGPSPGWSWDGARNATAAALESRLRLAPALQPAQPPTTHSAPEGPSAPATVVHFMASFARWLHAQTGPVTILADAGDSLFAAADMTLRPGDAFLAQGWYCSIGYSVPAAIGAACAHACSALVEGEGAPAAVRAPMRSFGGARRVACLVGDGAFQMTAQELSTAIREKLPITFFVLNNYGYGIERLIHQGPKGNDYNDVQSWDFCALARVFGLRGGVTRAVRTEAELLAAFADLDGEANAHGCNVIEVQLAQDDFSDALKRLGESIKAKNKLK